MKILFFIALLANICLFLWEFFDHNDSQSRQPIEPNPEPKQILLISELTPEQLATVIRATFVDQTDLQQNFNELSKPIDVVEEIRAPLTNPPKANETFILPASTESETLTIEPKKTITPINTPSPDTSSSNTPPPITSGTSSTPNFCYEAGPFDSKRAIQKWLSSRTFPMLQTQIITKMDQNTGKYMVYYPAAETYELSQEHIKQLKDLGIKDLWIFREGEDKGNISLGLGSDYANAIELQQKFQKKGITTLIKKHLRAQAVPTLFVQITLANAWPETINENDRVSIRSLNQCQP